MSCSADAPLPCGYRLAPIAFCGFCPMAFAPLWLPPPVARHFPKRCPLASCPGLSSALNRGLCPVPSPVLSFFVPSLFLRFFICWLVGLLACWLIGLLLDARWTFAGRHSSPVCFAVSPRRLLASVPSRRASFRVFELFESLLVLRESSCSSRVFLFESLLVREYFYARVFLFESAPANSVREILAPSLPPVAFLSPREE
jgi:hypothetical protein